VPSYITEAMIEARVTAVLLSRFVQQTTGSAAYSAAVLDVIERSEDAVNSYLSERFAVPVTTTGLLEECALAIGEWELYRRGVAAVPEKVKQAYDNAVKVLEAIRDGKQGTGAAVAPASAVSAGLETDGAAGLFDAASMEAACW
jgi:phage gp36-like protein